MIRRALPLLLVTLCACRALGGDLDVHRLEHGGRERTYEVHLPPKGVSTEGKPLLLVLHGGGGRGRNMDAATRGEFDLRADREGWVVCYPDGVAKGWNDGRESEHDRAHTENVDDVGFIASLVDALVAAHRLDPKRVYVTGASNGGMMTHRLAIELSGKIAAAAPVIAGIPATIASASAPSRPVPILAIAGDQDPLVPFGGGDVRVFGRARGKVISIPATARLWARWNRCAPGPEVARLEDRDPDDGMRVRRERWAPGPGGAEVVLYVVEGGGHCWPGGRQFMPELVIGKSTRDVDACDLIWKFFSEH